MTRVLFLLLLVATTAFAQPSTQKAAEELANTERAFSKYSEENGMFKAFVKYFVSDGIQFSPIPFNTHYEFAPELTKPKPEFTLAWFPTFTKVAATADLGFSIGPWTITDQSEKKRPPRNGYFFSIWRKLPEGWRVIVDSGVRTTSASTETPASWKPEPPPTVKRSSSNQQNSELYSIDRSFSSMAEKSGLLPAFTQH